MPENTIIPNSQKKQSSCRKTGRSFISPDFSRKLLLGRSADGAGAGASAAADAGIRINDELAIALRNRANRTFGRASASEILNAMGDSPPYADFRGHPLL